MNIENHLYDIKSLHNDTLKDKITYYQFLDILDFVGIVVGDYFIVLEAKSLEDLNPHQNFIDMCERLLNISYEDLTKYKLEASSYLKEWGWQDKANELNLPFKKNKYIIK